MRLGAPSFSSSHTGRHRARATFARPAALLVAMGLTASVALTGALMPSVASAETTSSTALTKSGKGAFAGLDVTVDQTENLVDQVVEVSWTGGEKTLPGNGQYELNYLQIMQCWGDDPDGPDRTQCQYGGFAGVDGNRGGSYAQTRQVTGGAKDPLETITAPPGKPVGYVPFKPYDDEAENGGLSNYFDALSTNEITYAQTRVDGTGREFFSLQTVNAAAGLGCGEQITVGGKIKGRGCWLVVVPRGDREVDDSQRDSSFGLDSSPLSQSNWNQRIVFPLDFEPVGDVCPIGAAERKVTGHEVVAEAVHRWQPALCGGGATIYNYSQFTDSAARRELVADDPGMVVMTRPLTAEENLDKRPVTYAPLAISGMTIAYNVDSQAKYKADPSVVALNGVRIDDMRLTPRLVAKLITQSYQQGAHPSSEAVKGNPATLLQDPEFLKLNPRFKDLQGNVADALLPVYRADVIELVWNWLMADPAAKAFLSGTPDEHGMKLNRDFLGMEVPRDDYPKSDKFCTQPTVTGAPARCTLDQHPYADDQLSAAKAAGRGDPLTRGLWDANGTPPAWKRDAVQPNGQRGLLALVDTASAHRFGLETAAIRNGAGEFVKPTTATMTAAVNQMQPSSVPSVLTPNPGTTKAGTYPLTSVSYAATPPKLLTPAERKDYAAFLRFAAGPGQIPGLTAGTLPEGYAPLTSKLRAQATAAAALLLKAQGSAGSTGSDSDDEPPNPSTVAENAPLDTTGLSGGGTAPTVVPASGAPSATGDLSGAALAAGATPADLSGLLRWAPLLALLVGLVAVVAGPLLLAWNRYDLSLADVRNRLPAFGR